MRYPGDLKLKHQLTFNSYMILAKIITVSLYNDNESIYCVISSVFRLLDLKQSLWD